MPFFAVHCADAENAPVLRQEHLEEHLRYIESIIDHIRVAGPRVQGSLLIVEAQDESAARALIDRDPYAERGVWSAVEVTEFRPVAGSWVGGISWAPRA